MLALRDREKARGPGGVADMVEIAPRRGAAVDVIDVGSLVDTPVGEPSP